MKGKIKANKNPGLWLTLLLTPLALSAQVQFYQEKIHIYVEEDQCHLVGEYVFKSSLALPHRLSLFYPVANAENPTPHFYRVWNVDSILIFKKAANGILFSLPFQTADSVIFVEYHQKTPAQKFTYILSTSQQWQTPIKDTEFIIEVPKNLKLSRSSMSYNKVVDNDSSMSFFIYRRNLHTSPNLDIQWEKKNE